MGTIGNAYRKLQSLDIEEVARKSIEQTKETIADLNVEQLNKGIRSDGSMMPDYSPVSVEVYGKPEGPIKLYDTGAFYQGFTVEVQGDKVVTTSTDSKTEKLYKRYATDKKNIFGLSGPFKREYLPVLQKAFRKNINLQTGL